MNIGEKLYELRKSKNLSQEEVAEKLNVTRQTVSKWETNQSTPDLDKIVPLCKLFEIGTEELLTGVSQKQEKEEKILTKQEVKIENAKMVSSSVLLYVLSLISVIVLEGMFAIKDEIVVSIFLLIAGFTTARLIKHFMSVPKFEKTEEEEKEEKLLKQINQIISGIFAIIYFILSFVTMAWHITWIIWIIDELIKQIIKLIFTLKEEKNNEK